MKHVVSLPYPCLSIKTIISGMGELHLEIYAEVIGSTFVSASLPESCIYPENAY